MMWQVDFRKQFYKRFLKIISLISIVATLQNNNQHPPHSSTMITSPSNTRLTCPCGGGAGEGPFGALPPGSKSRFKKEEIVKDVAEETGKISTDERAWVWGKAVHGVRIQPREEVDTR